ncbi:MAG: cupin-like domain-containing protein [Byssovorax sp.]
MRSTPPVRRVYPGVERRSGLDRATIEREYLSQNRPVILSPADTGWCARWTPEAIKARFGDREIEVEETKEVYVGDRALRRRPLGELIDGALGDDTSQRWKGLEFLAKVSGMSAALARDPSPIEALLPTGAHGPRSTLWIAPGKTMSSLHHDGNYDNLNLQVSGKKIFLLIEPKRHEELYRYGSAESPLNPFAPDLERFPRFADVEPVEAVLGPGDLLLIPKYWWHCVYAVEPSVNLATCFSWSGEPSAWQVLDGVPLVHRSLSVIAAEMKRRGLRRLADESRELWYSAYQRVVARVEPQARGELAEM